MNPTKSLARFGAAALSLSLLLAACGGESGDEELVNALSAELEDSEDFDELEVSEEEADCAAERVVDEIGADRIEELGFEDESEADLSEFSDEDLASVGSALDECVDGLRGLLVEEVQAGILEDPDESFPVDETEAECIAAGMVDELGVERLVVIGARSEGGDPFAAVSDTEGATVADVFVECVDFRPLFQEQFESQGVPADVASCLLDNIDDEAIRALFAAEFTGEGADTAAEGVLAPALETCGVPAP